MLTARYDWLGLQPGDLVLDLGCGGGRHAFEVARRGARVVAADLDLAELKDVRAIFGAMHEAGELRGPGPSGGEREQRGDGYAVGANALSLPFPDNSFDRIIASEVMEHIDDDAGAAAELARVLRPGGTIAVTVPSWLPEQICWALSDKYHAPFVDGGHVRIYTEATVRRRLRDAGLVPGGAHHAHALHSPYWWLKCAVGPTNNDHLLVQAYLRFLTWDITDAPLITRTADRLLNPVLGKSLVVYAEKPLP